MLSTRTIIRRFDAIDLELRLFSCSDGSVGASLPGADIRGEHTLSSLTGYGDDADGAIRALWQAVLDLDTGRESIRVERDGAEKRYFVWNGEAFKEVNRAEMGLAA